MNNNKLERLLRRNGQHGKKCSAEPCLRTTSPLMMMIMIATWYVWSNASCRTHWDEVLYNTLSCASGAEQTAWRPLCWRAAEVRVVQGTPVAFGTSCLRRGRLSKTRWTRLYKITILEHSYFIFLKIILLKLFPRISYCLFQTFQAPHWRHSSCLLYTSFKQNQIIFS